MQHETNPDDAIPEFTNPELVDTGVDNPDAAADDPDVDHLTREDVERDPGEATRKLPKNQEAV